MQNDSPLFNDIFTDFFKSRTKETVFNLHYDDGTNNFAITRPTTSAVNVAVARQILNECTQEELAKAYWDGFNTIHLFVHTSERQTN